MKNTKKLLAAALLVVRVVASFIVIFMMTTLISVIVCPSILSLPEVKEENKKQAELIREGDRFAKNLCKQANAEQGDLLVTQNNGRFIVTETINCENGFYRLKGKGLSGGDMISTISPGGLILARKEGRLSHYRAGEDYGSWYRILP